jgi:hypothetical protein
MRDSELADTIINLTKIILPVVRMKPLPPTKTFQFNIEQSCAYNDDDQALSG